MLFGNEIITSRQNSTVVKLFSLLDKKERKKHRLFRIDGYKLFCEALECGARIELVAVCSEKADRFMPLAQKSGAKTVLLSPEVFSKITDEKSPDGIIAVVKYIDGLHKALSPSDIPSIAASGKRIMAFESLRDPGNLGTVIRSASAFGEKHCGICRFQTRLDPDTAGKTRGTSPSARSDVCFRRNPLPFRQSVHAVCGIRFRKTYGDPGRRKRDPDRPGEQHRRKAGSRRERMVPQSAEGAGGNPPARVGSGHRTVLRFMAEQKHEDPMENLQYADTENLAEPSACETSDGMSGICDSA